MLSDFYGDGSFDEPKYGRFVLQQQTAVSSPQG